MYAISANMSEIVPSSESDDSDNEEMQELQVTVMDKISVVEGAFLELTHEHELGVKVCSCLYMIFVLLSLTLWFVALGIVLEHSFKFDLNFMCYKFSYIS